MNTFLWIVQGFLAVTFLYSGVCKSSMTREWLVSHGQTGVANLSHPLIRSIGLVEIIGAAGIVLPWATGIAPILTPIASLGFAVIMLFAAPIHARRSEWKAVGLNLVLLILSLWVAYERYSKLSKAERISLTICQ